MNFIVRLYRQHITVEYWIGRMEVSGAERLTRHHLALSSIVVGSNLAGCGLREILLTCTNMILAFKWIQ